MKRTKTAIEITKDMVTIGFLLWQSGDFPIPFVIHIDGKGDIIGYKGCARRA